MEVQIMTKMKKMTQMSLRMEMGTKTLRMTSSLMVKAMVKKMMRMTRKRNIRTTILLNNNMLRPQEQGKNDLPQQPRPPDLTTRGLP